VPDVRVALQRAKVPRIAVTPIVGGQAIKGPAGKMLAELGHDVSALGVAKYYQRLVDGFVLDVQDAALKPEIEKLGLKVKVADTMMHSESDKQRVARAALEFVDELAADGRHS
jgi:LPPG:FO 2-phospho-L-lactate transferase